MEVIMDTRKKLFLTALVYVFFLGAIPTYADTLKVSFKQSNTRSIPNNIKCRIDKTKGRNRRTVKCTPARNVAYFNNPKIGGLRIDACVRGTGWGKSNAQRCDPQRLARIANEFCKSKGFKKSKKTSKASHKGRHAVLTYKKGQLTHSFWKRQIGSTQIKTIICQ